MSMIKLLKNNVIENKKNNEISQIKLKHVIMHASIKKDRAMIANYN